MKKNNGLQSEKIIKKADVILLVSVIGISLIFLMSNFIIKANGKKVWIYVESEKVRELFLQEDTEYTIETPQGKNIIVIEDEKVSVSYADCRDKICQKHKPISKSNEQIICLPHKVVIEVKR